MCVRERVGSRRGGSEGREGYLKPEYVEHCDGTVSLLLADNLVDPGHKPGEQPSIEGSCQCVSAVEREVMHHQKLPCQSAQRYLVSNACSTLIGETIASPLVTWRNKYLEIRRGKKGLVEGKVRVM